MNTQHCFITFFTVSDTSCVWYVRAQTANHPADGWRWRRSRKKVSLLKSIRWQNSAWSAISEENEPACCGLLLFACLLFHYQLCLLYIFLFYALSIVLRGKMSRLMGQAICCTAAMMESEWRYDNIRVVFSFFCFSSWTFSCFHFPFFSCV